jgi:hypothetical protein
MRWRLICLGATIAGTAMAIAVLAKGPRGPDSVAPSSNPSLERSQSDLGIERSRVDILEDAELAGDSRRLIPEHSALAATDLDGESSVVSGTVRVGGLPPGESLTLRLIAGQGQSGISALSTLVAADGSFVFKGLSAGWQGWIQIPQRYYVEIESQRERAIAVTAPSTEVAIELERVPYLTARLIARSTGLAVSSAEVQGVLFWKSDSPSISDGIQTTVTADVEQDGSLYANVESWFTGRQLEAVELTVGTPEGMHGSFYFADERLPAGLDLGTLELDDGVVLKFIVRDSDLQPVAGARVRLADVAFPFEVSDEEGRATLPGLEAGAKVLVLARGFDPSILEVPAIDATMEVALGRATRVGLRVLDVTGSPAEGVRVQARSGTPLFVGTKGSPDAFLVPQVPKGAVWGTSTSGLRYFYWFCTDASGAVDLQSVIPGIPFELALLDDLDTEVLRRSVAALQPQEARDIVLELPVVRRMLRGIVEDPAGMPIEGAQVLLENGRGGPGRATGTDGRFTFDRLFTPEANLEIKRSGYSTKALERVAIQAEPYDLRVVLEPARTVRVRVLDSLGSNVEFPQVRAKTPGGDREWSSESTEAGDDILADLPFEELDLSLLHGGRWFQVRLGARQEVVEFVVPALGRLEIVAETGRTGLHELAAVELRWLEDPDVSVRTYCRSEPLPVIFDGVFAGRHELVYLKKESDKTDLINYVPYGTPLFVEVVAGQTTQVVYR